MFFKKEILKPQILELSAYNDRKVLLVFVHGLAGNRSTWQHFENLLQSEEMLKNYLDLAFYTYPTGLSYDVLTKYPNLYAIADGLRSFININCSKYKNIILIGHSMGGLIARKYLLDEVMTPGTIKVKALILYATPNTGSSLANIATTFHRFNIHIRQLCKRSDFIRELGRLWKKFNVSGRASIKFVVAGTDRIVDEESARSEWGESSVEVDIHKTHKNIIHAANHQDLSYGVLIQEAKKVIALLEEMEEPPYDDEEAEED